MRRQDSIIQKALPLVARAVGRRLDVEVRVGGKRAYTQGRIIGLPSLPFEDPEVEILAFGYLEHEAAHIRYSEAVPELIRSPLHQALTNLFEDIRVEQALGREYPGFRVTLRRLVAKLVKDGQVFPPPTAQASPAQTLQRYLLYRLRCEVLQQPALAAYAQQARIQFRAVVPSAIATRIDAVMERVTSLQSTRETAELAGELLDLLEAEKGSLTASTGDGTESGQENEVHSAPTASVRAGHRLDALLKAKGHEVDADFATQVAVELSQAASASAMRSGAACAGIGRVSEPPVASGDSAKILAEVREATTALRTRLRLLVEASRRVKRGHARNGWRLDERKLVEAMKGDPAIYRKRVTRPAIDTAVLVLLDRSSSMRKLDRIEVASRSTLAVVAGLVEIPGLAVAAAAYPGHSAEIDPLTRFGEPLRNTASRYAAVTASGGTPLLPALFWAAEVLMLRPESRKILLVVTDGEPFERDVCREAIRRCWAGGLEALGLGIRVPTIAELFSVSECIDEVSELASAMFGLLQNVLIRKTV